MAAKGVSFRVTVWALILGATIGSVGASTTGVSAKRNRESLEACLKSLGKHKDSVSFAFRRPLALADTHTVMRGLIEKHGGYKGKRDQNLHLLDDYCPDWRKKKSSSSGYGRKRSRESFATQKSSRISWELYRTIRKAARDTARNHGLDEEKFLQTIGCESIGFDPNAKNPGFTRVNGKLVRSIDRGIAQINDVHHPKVTDAQAYNWRWSLGYAARTMKVDRRLKNGTMFSQAAYWYCYKLDEYLGYGVASIKAQSIGETVASRSD